MTNKNFAYTAAVIFAAVAVIHGLRLIYGWEGLLGGWQVPIWLSWVAVVVAAWLAFQGFKLSGKR